jgi:glucans biosynthesis protein
VPEWLLKLNFDQYREIRFVPVRSWWNRDKVPFRLQFFHPGFIFDRTVQINEVDGGNVSPIPFQRRLFDYGPNAVGPLPPEMGYAGFRIHNSLNVPGDELGVFQGASYFRFLCRRAVYGLSARGLAVNTGEPGGEEFPTFEEFWVVKPVRSDAESIAVYALLDGPSVAGAYRFDIGPGADTVMRIRAAIYCRKAAVLGLAPLTSMFWHGKNSNFETDDLRPEVHDSDGVMIHNGAGEWLWRPLTNPASLLTQSFLDENPRGFGLLQRERRYEAYEDITAAYQLRPSAWVEPRGDWGRGSVRLVELPTPDETNDNIVLFWAPAPPPHGEPVEIEYDLHWFLDQIHPPTGWAVATRHGRSRTFETDLERFVVDFDGPQLRRAEPEAGIAPVVTVGTGAALVHAVVEKNPNNDTWRVSFAFRPDGRGQPVELRCFLTALGRPLTETWTYLWQP